MPERPSLNGQSRQSLREQIADELAHNDACGPGPVSRQEYLDDAEALLRIVAAHVSVHGTEALHA